MDVKDQPLKGCTPQFAPQELLQQVCPVGTSSYDSYSAGVMTFNLAVGLQAFISCQRTHICPQAPPRQQQRASMWSADVASWEGEIAAKQEMMLQRGYSSGFCELVLGLMHPDPHKRLSCEAAKSHSYWSSVPGFSWDKIVAPQRFLTKVIAAADAVAAKSAAARRASAAATAAVAPQ